MVKKNEQKILGVLENVYGDTKPALKFGSTFQLLVAVVLSAQTNDNQVNRITELLFQKFPRPEDYAALTPEELEPYIKTCGLYKNKAKNIVALSKKLLNDHQGAVPADREQLMALPGVGRKTANVVLSVGFDQPALAVDTHVFRVAHRLGLSPESSNTPDKVEEDLCRIIPEKKWGQAHHWLIWHGRRVCNAQRPKCGECPLESLCPYQKGTLTHE